jgi:tRNA-splicing ligase RtcB
MFKNYIFDNQSRHPVKHWTRGVPMDKNTLEQLRMTANMPFIFKHVAAMPDAHYGNSATVGSVIATQGAVVPASIGVDLSCGMSAVKTTLTANDLPDNLFQLRMAIEAAVPHGDLERIQKFDAGVFQNGQLPKYHEQQWLALLPKYNDIVAKNPKIEHRNGSMHMGTLGKGNHFIEICLDENGAVWALLHSGSRGVGGRIGSYFIDKAKKEMERYFMGEYLPNTDLSYLVEKTEVFEDYIEAIRWAGDFASANRASMMHATIGALKSIVSKPFTLTELAVNCHHNYIDRENHYGKNVWVTRKGATRARKGELGIIPGSMGTGSFIVEGLGNADSFCSCSHGAGRVMSRNEARKVITMEAHKASMTGIEARCDNNILDESPAAYKDLNAVMNAQSDLVDIKYHLKQVVNVKGS